MLRSKDIEASGFNGTAAFMEVRVQSIVVEFILTHVPQLFPGEGASGERRKSLPSPSAMYSQDMLFQKASHIQPSANFGNISPGDGPLPIRPYHAIIEGTDKRKGSLKGRKWMSIFNIGGRFQETRKKHKCSTKEKEKVVLRPARSMDSLSTPSYPNEGSRRSGQRPPSNIITPILPPSSQSVSNIAPAAGGMGGSEYAVTYRRGTGLVSGGAGTMGTYTAIDPEGLGLTSSEVVQARSPGLSSKVGRRAAMHITGPTTVTVPLHITSSLALGVLQGAGSDRLIHRGKEKDLGDKVEGKEEGDKLESKEQRGTKSISEGGREVEEMQESQSMTPQGNEKDNSNSSGVNRGGDKEVKSLAKQEPTTDDQGASREQRTKSFNSRASESVGDKEDGSEYIDMKGPGKLEDGSGHDGVFDASDILNSTEGEGSDIELSGYVQDNFDFLDHMDCSVLDHMDSSTPYQVNEFSVEPPGHSEDEYEMMEQAQSSQEAATPVHDLNPNSGAELKPHRPLSLDLHSRHTKSLSLPYITPPIHGQPESSSEEEVSVEEDSHDEDYSSGEDESMFVQSLPADFLLSTLSGLELDVEEPKCSQSDQSQVREVPSSEEKHCPPPSPDLPPDKETLTSDEEQEEGLEEEDKDEPEETEDQRMEMEIKIESKEAEEHLSVTRDAQSQKPQTSETLTAHCVEFPSSENEDESNPAAETPNEDNDDISPIDSLPEVALCIPQPETVSPEKVRETLVGPKEPPGGDAPKGEDECQQSVLEMTECTDNACQDSIINEQESEMWRENHDLWNDLEDVVCEVIEEREKEQSEAEAPHVMKEEKEDEQSGSGSEEKCEKADETETNKSEVREESEGETVKMPEGEFTNSSAGKAETANQETCGSTEEDGDHNRETVKEQKDKELDDEQSITQQSEDKPPSMPKSRPKHSNDSGMDEISIRGVGRKLVVSKQPKVYQVKAVPVVPPKPQHCKITALTLRQQQQQQQKERLEADKGKDGLLRVQPEPDKEARDGAEESLERQERQLTLRERRRDGAEGVMRDSSSRNSPLSLCFDEAVAMATLRREKERAREGEADVDRMGK
uniref:Rho GTPase-activating protein 30 n=1 Tax=Oryzias sinensis TaxID=183150 RepID=A0A8C7V2U1_9TELE